MNNQDWLDRIPMWDTEIKKASNLKFEAFWSEPGLLF
jgi:hypothetical protein